MEWNKACLPCRLVHTTCDGKRPCRRCVKLGKPSTCINVEKKRRGRPPKNKNLNAAAPATASAAGLVSTRPAQSAKNERAARAKSEAARKSLPVNQYGDAFNYEGGRRRSSRRASTRSVVEATTRVQSPPVSSEDEDEDDNHSEEEDDDDDYFGEDRHRRASLATVKKRKSPPPAKTLPSRAGKTTSDFVTKRPRVEAHELEETTPATHSGPVSPDVTSSNSAVCVDDEQLPLLLDPSYAWIDDLDPTGEMPNADSFLPLDLFGLSLPGDSLASSPATPPPSMLPLPPVPHMISREPPPASPLPSFEFRDGFADEYDGLDECHAEDGHDHDHDCTCTSSPHSFSGDAVDTELVNSLFGMVSDQVGELKKANQDLCQSIDTLWQSFNERFEREEKRVNDLHQLVLTTRLSSPPSSAEGADPGLGRSTRWEVLRELPFLLDWADDIDFANPDGFVIDDMSKPFIVRRLATEPMLDPTQSLPVSVYASPAFCSFIRAPSHDIVGTLCYKAQEEPLRWFLAKKSPQPVGELCYLPLTRQIGERTVQSLTKNQLFYDRNGTAKWWILVVEQFMLLGETTAAAKAAAAAVPPGVVCPTGNPGETSEEEEQRLQRCHRHDAKLVLGGVERLTDLRPPLEQQLLS